MSRTHQCTPVTVNGRLRKAEMFRDAASNVMALADDEQDVLDACITLWVHAGVAAADVLCCKRLGEHAQGDNHNEAVALLSKVDNLRANDLALLLRLKTPVSYGAGRSTAADGKRAQVAWSSRRAPLERAGCHPAVTVSGPAPVPPPCP